MKNIKNWVLRFLRLVFSSVAGHILIMIITAISALLLPIITNKWEMLRVWGRILQDGLQSGFMRGTPFQNAEGSWAVAWRLGGPPFIHFILPFGSLSIFLIVTSLTAVHVVRRYRYFKRLRRLCTYLRHPKSFYKTVSARLIAVCAVLILAGFIGIAVDPRVIVPNSEESPDYFITVVGVSMSLSVKVIHGIVVNVSPSVLDMRNMTGWFYVNIRSPNSTMWRVSDIDASSIILNDKVGAASASVATDQNNATAMLAKFDKRSLVFVFEDQDALRLGAIMLKVSGNLVEDGYFFQGSALLKIMQA